MEVYLQSQVRNLLKEIDIKSSQVYALQTQKQTESEAFNTISSSLNRISNKLDAYNRLDLIQSQLKESRNKESQLKATIKELESKIAHFEENEQKMVAASIENQLLKSRIEFLENQIEQIQNWHQDQQNNFKGWKKSSQQETNRLELEWQKQAEEWHQRFNQVTHTLETEREKHKSEIENAIEQGESKIKIVENIYEEKIDKLKNEIKDSQEKFLREKMELQNNLDKLKNKQIYSTGTQTEIQDKSNQSIQVSLEQNTKSTQTLTKLIESSCQTYQEVEEIPFFPKKSTCSEPASFVPTSSFSSPPRLSRSLIVESIENIVDKHIEYFNASDSE